MSLSEEKKKKNRRKFSLSLRNFREKIVRRKTEEMKIEEKKNHKTWKIFHLFLLSRLDWSTWGGNSS
jgi:hypothetical protein